MLFRSFLFSLVLASSLFIGTTNAYADCVVSTTADDTELNGWGTSGGPLIAQSFTTTCDGFITEINALIEDNIFPADEVEFGLYLGNPSGTMIFIASSTATGSPYPFCSIGGGNAIATFSAEIDDATEYTLMYGRTGSLNSQGYASCGLAGGGYSGGSAYLYDGSSWTPSSHDYNVSVTILTDPTPPTPPGPTMSTSTNSLSTFLGSYGPLLILIATCFLLLAMFKFLYDTLYAGQSIITGRYE